ncbi:acetoin utilization protein AcuC [Hamadaea tsunoensis]|uniref:acetoin utilization protein AcuC n=1 Tax=Hamadaea tsunoensis TaxID=53368 RepID=UPI0006851F56|nr:acetoin utilization protein AcuC [Hamadaea tsunoensis]
MGDHPLNPVRLRLTMALADAYSLLDRDGVTVAPPTAAASDAELGLVHREDYIAAVKAAPDDPFFRGYGLNTPDNPTFDGMHEASALIAGATLTAARAVWAGEQRRAVNIAGGLHHAMHARAAGFCVYNDPAIAIKDLLERGAERIAYVDIDVHHGDGVQAAFIDDPRVLTISLHESPLSLFPGTGFPDETGVDGTAVNVALPTGTDDRGWLRAFHAVVPSLVRAFRPQILFTQCGADPHRLDPLANLRLSVDGQRAAYLALRDLAEELCEGRWVATGGGGYALVEAVPRAWTHLIAAITGEPLDPARLIPAEWKDLAAELCPQRMAMPRMTDDADLAYRAWDPDGDPSPLDRAILATRKAVFPLHGLDPFDPRD